MKKLAIFGLGFLATLVPALAQTPDGQPPSVETVCDGQTGAAYGLCNAYCEAMDCDSPSPQASPTACGRVRTNYTRITGQPLPCDVTCPCVAGFPLFAAIQAGTVTIDQCLQNDAPSTTSVITAGGAFAIVNGSAAPPYCSVNDQQFQQITPLEATVCQFLLRQAAAAQGVACVAPE
jgi:hypothetical protein